MLKTYVNPKKVAILLSTFNGARYLGQQLQSIFDQTFNDFTLYIRDDLSSDETLKIISEYKQKYPDRIELIESKTNLGSTKSFLYLLELVDSEYYFFSDQDDVWLPQKVEITLNSIIFNEKSNSNSKCTPTIVHTDLKLVDKNLNIIAESFWKNNNILVNIPHKFRLYCHYNDLTGCSMGFNYAVKNVMMNYSHIDIPQYIYHDHYIGLIVTKENGNIIPIENVTILFRRHGDNCTDPLKKDTSILRKPHLIFQYIKYQHNRLKFYQNIDHYPLISYFYNKIRIFFIKKGLIHLMK